MTWSEWEEKQPTPGAASREVRSDPRIIWNLARLALSGNRKIGLLSVVFSVATFGCSNGDTQDSLTITGNIEMTQVDIAFKLPGKVAQLALAEGDHVGQGDVVARLEASELDWQRKQAVASQRVLSSRINELEAQIRFQRASRDGQIRQRQADLEQAEAQLRSLRAGARPQELEQAQAALSGAEAEYEKAKSDWERAQSLFRDEDISRNQYDQAKAAFDGATASLRRTREQLSLVQEGPRSEDIEAAQARVEKAQATLDLARSLDLEIARSRQSIQTLQAEIARAEALVSQLDSQIEDTVAVSPLDGIVLQKNAEVGEVVGAGIPVLSLGDIARPWLRGYISESDLGRIKLGSRVEIKTDSFPNKVYPGEVTFIASEAEFTPKQIQTPQERVKLVYRIKVSVANPDQELKLNMPCDARVLLGL